MDQNKLQHNFRDITESRFDDFIRAFNETYEPRVVKPVTQDSHVRVYHYGEGKNKFNICYDRIASSIQMTAGATMLDIMRMYLERSGCVCAEDPLAELGQEAASKSERIVAVAVNERNTQSLLPTPNRAKDLATVKASVLTMARSGSDAAQTETNVQARIDRSPRESKFDSRVGTGVAQESRFQETFPQVGAVKPLGNGSKTGPTARANRASGQVEQKDAGGRNLIKQSAVPMIGAQNQNAARNAIQPQTKTADLSASKDNLRGETAVREKQPVASPNAGKQTPGAPNAAQAAGKNPSDTSAPQSAGKSVAAPNTDAGRTPSALEKIFGKKSAKAAKKEKSKPLAVTSSNSQPVAAVMAAVDAARDAERSYKDGYSLDKYERERFERGITELETSAQVAKVTREESNSGTAQHTIKISVLGKDKSKTTVQYAVRRKVMQIQGKPGALADLVQNVFSEDASEKAIIQARVEFNKAREKKPKEKVKETPGAPPAPPKSPEKAQEQKPKDAEDSARLPAALQKALNKALPNGVKYLSKQSQTYLYYALVDLESNLSNYGGILATAYQGLENLISNLQRSEGIKVKLIGQAYEKENGKYTLKQTYRRKIKSVVYNEVLSALYTEYFDKRHFYTHSDNFSDTARIIQSQAEAKAEFARLVTVIEYNSTKLSEIGFTVDNAAAFSLSKGK